MEANIIIEMNSVLDDKQNTKIRQILQNGCLIFSVIYCIKMLIKVNQGHTVSFDIHVKVICIIMPIKVNQIHAVSFNKHVLSSIVISRLYIK